MLSGNFILRGVLAQTVFALLFCIPSPSSAQPGLPGPEERPVAAPAGQVANGFVIMASLGGEANLFSTLASRNPVTPSSGLRVGLLLGGKIGRVIFGGGIQFGNITVNGSGPSSSLYTSFLFTPEIMAALARSADQRVEFILDAALGFGALVASTTGPGGSTTNNFLLSYQLGPGARFWAHPHFAIQGLAGFSGQAVFDMGTATSVHGLFATLGLLGAI